VVTGAVTAREPASLQSIPRAVRHPGGARAGETRGRVRSLSETIGRADVELKPATVAALAACPVAHVVHAAVDRLPAPACS
jgi:hypothetical protein